MRFCLRSLFYSFSFHRTEEKKFSVRAVFRRREITWSLPTNKLSSLQCSKQLCSNRPVLTDGLLLLEIPLVHCWVWTSLVTSTCCFIVQREGLLVRLRLITWINYKQILLTKVTSIQVNTLEVRISLQVQEIFKDFPNLWHQKLSQSLYAGAKYRTTLRQTTLHQLSVSGDNHPQTNLQQLNKNSSTYWRQT